MNPYYQYFIGLPGFDPETPFAPSLLMGFRKSLTDPKSPEQEGPDNQGTLILDATCAPQHIVFSQDINLLNEARENLETIIDTVCYKYNE